MAGPGAVTGEHAGVPAVWLLTPLHLHCGPRKRREVQALETERVWTHQVPLESRSHMQNEVRSRTRQPQFPASQAKPGIQTLPTKS